MPALAGKTAIVTGASSGIGRATARLFAEQGARVVVAARRQRELDTLVAEIAATGAEAAALIEAGAIDGLSIGYRTRKASKQPAGTRLLSALDLWEVSLVTFPMLPDARVGAKSGDGPDGWLDDISAAFRDMRRALAGDGPNPLS